MITDFLNFGFDICNPPILNYLLLDTGLCVFGF